MKIISKAVTTDDLKGMAEGIPGSLVRAVVDVRRNIIAVGGELHSDLEALLLSDGSKTEDLWGINLYPGKQDGGFIKFDSPVNAKPSAGNAGVGIDSSEIRLKIVEVVNLRVVRRLST